MSKRTSKGLGTLLVLADRISPKLDSRLEEIAKVREVHAQAVQAAHTEL